MIYISESKLVTVQTYISDSIWKNLCKILHFLHHLSGKLQINQIRSSIAIYPDRLFKTSQCFRIKRSLYRSFRSRSNRLLCPCLLYTSRGSLFGAFQIITIRFVNHNAVRHFHDTAFEDVYKRQVFHVKAPNKWSAEFPYRYTLVAELKDKKNRTIETVSTIVGFRKVEIKDTPASCPFRSRCV